MGSDISKPKHKVFFVNLIHVLKYAALCFIGTNVYWSFTFAFILAYAFLDKINWSTGAPWIVASAVFIGYVLFLYAFLLFIDFVLNKVFKILPRTKLRRIMVTIYLLLCVFASTIALISMNTTYYSDIEIQIAPQNK